MAKWINLLGIVGGIFAFVHFVLGGMVNQSSNQQNVQSVAQQQIQTNGLRDPRTLVKEMEKSRAQRTIENYEQTARMIEEFDQNSGFTEEFEARRAHHAEALRSMRGY